MERGFTLAEVLIAMTIVGIISVLTVPSVMQNTFTKANIAKLQAVHAQVSQAVKQAMVDERINDLRDSEFVSSTANQQQSLNIDFIEKYFNMSKSCTTVSDCFASTYKEIKNASLANSINYIKTDKAGYAILTNGAAIALDLSSQMTSSTSKAHFVVDVNGKESPNIFGRDLFQFFIYPDGFVGVKEDTWTLDDDEDAADFNTQLTSKCTNSTDKPAAACFLLLQQNNWKADY